MVPLSPPSTSVQPLRGPRDPGLHSGRTPGHTLHQTSDGWAAGSGAQESDQGRCPSTPTSHRANAGSTQALSGSAPVDSFIPISGRQQDPEVYTPPQCQGIPGSGHSRWAAPSQCPRVALLRPQFFCPCPCLSSVSGVGLLSPRLHAWVIPAQQASWRVSTPW